jgi:beta-glucosidase
MNSFTRVGTKWCGACKELITDILRDEWGWQGINITDWRDNPCMSYVDAMVAGTDSYDGNANAANKGAEFARYKDSKVISWRLRESCKRVIYNVLKTNATNGLSSATTIVEITPWWHTVTLALGYSFLGLTGITGALLGLSIFFKIKEKKVA